MNKKAIWVIIILTAVMAISFGLPKPKYESLDVLSFINIPMQCGKWRGEDNDQDEQSKDARYNFISRVFSRHYAHSDGTDLVMLILDAGNFHNPKVCFNGAGFNIKDMPAREFDAAGRRLKAYLVNVKRGENGYLIFYWMTIDKAQADWVEQKAKQFLASLINKKKAGLMVRIDMAVNPGMEEAAYLKVQDFLTSLGSTMREGDIDYVFGKRG